MRVHATLPSSKLFLRQKGRYKILLPYLKPQVQILLHVPRSRLRAKYGRGWGPMRGFAAAAQGRSDDDGRRHFVDAIAAPLATTTKTCGNSPTMGLYYWTKRTTSLSLSCFFFLPRSFCLSSPEANLLSFSLACIVLPPSLSLSPEGIVLASVPASSFPPSLSGQPTPFHANYMLSGGLFSQPTGA